MAAQTFAGAKTIHPSSTILEKNFYKQWGDTVSDTLICKGFKIMGGNYNLII